MQFGLLGVNSDAKTIKGRKIGYQTAILYLAPAQEASPKNLCPYSSKGCRAACLYTAGRGGMQKIKDARIAKTMRFLNNRDKFMENLFNDIYRFKAWATRKSFKPCVRLNGTSDIMWERIPVKGHANIMDAFPYLQFYDYTKIPYSQRQKDGKAWQWPLNYDLTFSREENNHGRCLQALEYGQRVAAVWKQEIPKEYLGFPVIDGDETDLRFLEPGAVWVGLKAKGQAKHDDTGFVI